MEVQVLVSYLAAILAAGIGAFTDFKFHKIYNKLTMPAMILGFVLNLFLGGIGGLLNSLLGWCLGMTFAIAWLLGVVKAGDVKLYMAIGALAGWKFCGYTMVCSVLIGGAAGFLVMLVRKDGRAALKRLKIYGQNLFYTKAFHRYQPEEEHAYFSYGGCILAGTLIAAWYLMFY